MEAKEVNISNREAFHDYLNKWKKETEFSSLNNLDNHYFKEIVGMGREAVPYILKEIERQPSQLVHALDMIFPGVVKYKGFVSLEKACATWISILRQTGYVS